MQRVRLFHCEESEKTFTDQVRACEIRDRVIIFTPSERCVLECAPCPIVVRGGETVKRGLICRDAHRIAHRLSLGPDSYVISEQVLILSVLQTSQLASQLGESGRGWAGQGGTGVRGVGGGVAGSPDL